VIDLREFLPPGSGVWWGRAAAEAQPLVDALIEQTSDYQLAIRAFGGPSWNNEVVVGAPGMVSMVCRAGAGKPTGLGDLDVLPCHYSALPRLFVERRLPCDVGIVQVSPPDGKGMCSLGIGVDYVADAIVHTPVLVGEINQRMPFTVGSRQIPIDSFAATVFTDRRLPEDVNGEPDPPERRIAAHISDLIDDGDTVQIEPGRMGAAVLTALSDHADLGFHTGVITREMIHLVETGVANGSCKEIDTGLLVANAAAGSEELYLQIPELPVRLLPISYTHNIEVLSQLHSLVTVHFASEIDLSGHFGAGSSNGVDAGAASGQTDFTRAASLTGKRSIVALRAISRGVSAIKCSLGGGLATSTYPDVDVVVTEYGVAHLRGCSLVERARRLIAIAAPEFRDHLNQKGSIV